MSTDADQQVTIASRSDLEEVFQELADINTALNRKQATQQKAVRSAKADHAPRITELTERLTALTNAIEAYCRANGEQMKQEAGKKTIELVAGDIQFRAGREKLVYTDDETAVIERLQEVGLDHLVDRTPSISKRTLMKHRDEIEDIKGIEIERGEEEIKLKPLVTA